MTPAVVDVAAEIARRNARVRAYLDADPFAASLAPPHLRAVATAYLARGGKGLRPALLLLCCGAVGGDEEVALPAAAAVEVTHNWTLIHDDIIDRDDTRRGGPAGHVLAAEEGKRSWGLGDDDARHYGLTLALLGGDIGVSWAHHLLSRLTENPTVPPAVAAEITTELSAVTVRAVLEGEAQDVRLAYADVAAVTIAEVEAMLAQKTGALFAWAARAGARLGGAPREVAEALGTFALKCGVAFQYADDTLPYVADERKVGKPAFSDIREGKRTAAVVAAYQEATEDERKALRSVLGRPQTSEGELREAMAIIVNRGGVAFAQSRARALHAEAIKALKILPPGQYRAILESLSSLLINRDH